MKRKPLTTTVAILLATSSALAQSGVSTKGSNFRPPSVPLVTSDPYFSIWSPHNEATDGDTTHWTGRPHRLTSSVVIDGKDYRILGVGEGATLNQTNLTLTPTQTKYTFEGAGVEVTLSFMSPLLPDDLLQMSKPVTYVTWTAKSTDGKDHNVSVLFTAGPELVVDKADQQNVADSGMLESDNFAAHSLGSADQNVLRTRGDDLRIDWGHLYLAVPKSAKDYVIQGTKAGRADRASPLKAQINFNQVGSTPVSKYAILAYDDEVSIKYYRTQLKPYWRKDGADAKKLLSDAVKDYESLVKRCDAFDAELVADLRKTGGESLAQLGVLAWRQALAAQKICADDNGQPLSFSKENNSNGCIATVDVLYPAAPQMLVFAPSLLKASLVPLMDYSASPRWKHDSAPHDLGTYPHATGQVYGGEKTSPMPVEESGNMLVLFGALSKVEGNADLAKKYWPVLTTWKNYLVSHGLDPANQLCTDDFAGHFARNANLSAKAIMGIAAWGLMADMLGHKEEAAQAHATARDYVKKWMAMGDQGDHYGLVFGEEGKGTWSQKYNFVWDKLLDLKVVPSEVISKEMTYYRTKLNKFGLPLDSRRNYTKLDWELWTATMAEDPKDFQAIVDACAKWANSTPSRVPLNDWYSTTTGKMEGFKARSVVGGLFIPLMADAELWKKYASRDKLNPSNWAPAPTEMPEWKTIIAAADKDAATWSYTTNKPADAWFTPGFNVANWKTGKAGFGAGDPPSAIINTRWNTPEIWIRRDFELADTNLKDPHLYLYHDENVEVYLNGKQIFKANGFVAAYDIFPLNSEAKAALKKGKNTIAIHCRQTTGGQYIDAGLVDLLPPKTTASAK